ncbi:MAG: immune inhibitor A [Myxococcales bacterium]|nr:immune inhibitor A [Myxococcales bacterium]
MHTRTLPALALVALTGALQLVTPAAAAPPEAARLVDDLAALRFERLGDPVTRWDAIPPVTAPKDRPHHLLVVLVAFPDRGFDRFAGEADQPAKLAAWYQEQLFDEGYTRPHTLSRYYREQSMGLYHIQGTVLPPVVLDHPRAAYGAPVRPEGGDWRNDADAEALVTEALARAVAAHPELDPALLDRWDPHDIDGDGLREEADGYLDHLVLVIAGGGQSSCHGLYDLDDVFTPDAPADVTGTLDPAARECAERIWPHRFVLQRGEGDGPTVEGLPHRRGGVALRPDLWIRDYNIQSEYIDRSTFTHEFAHGLGLPDVYARATSNSTGPWSVMSATADPEPQNLTAWSRLQLGWLRPAIIRPPAFGGERTQSIYLRTLDDPRDPPAEARALQTAGVWRAALVPLPPKTRHIELTPLPKADGARALYSGQGNDLDRKVELTLDLTKNTAPVRLGFDAWWNIEAGWDFAYLETSLDDGRTWTRRLPTDRGVMPAAHGHDGKGTLPGFTGLSGDRDGDGKNESNPRCDPKQKRAHGEDRIGLADEPCRVATWTRAEFALDDLAGHHARVRLRYFSDMAAVQPGILIDALRVTAGGGFALNEDFEGALHPAIRLEGFVPSPGHHTLLVPHYYLLEYRDPYADGPDRADRSIAADDALRFYRAPDGVMHAIRARPRPGVVAWYVDGAWPWSENDPADLGPGRGYLLALDAWPEEITLPGLEGWLRDTPGGFTTHYVTDGDATQKALATAWHDTLCFVRAAAWRPAGLTCPTPAAGLDGLTLDGRPLMYSYQRAGDLLPGPDRERYASAGELVDDKKRDGVVSYRLRDRSLRHLHTYDAPFALDDFPDGIEYYELRDGKLVRTGSAPHPAVSAYSDATPARWQNPKLPFGGVTVPAEGFGFRLARPKPGAPAAARVKVYFTWDR